VTKLLASVVVLHTLSYLACSDAFDANSSGASLRPGLPVDVEDASTPTSESDSLEANCPATTIADPGQIGPIAWLTELGEDAATNPSSVATDARHDAYMTSAKGGTVKIGAGGAVLWSKPFGSLVAAAPEGGVFVAGHFEGTLDVDGMVLAATGANDVFVVKLDADGLVERTAVFGGAEDELVQSIAVAPDGRVLLSGSGLGTLSLGEDGTVGWQKALYGFVATDSNGNAFVTGALAGSVDFGDDTLTSAGGTDVFVTKLDAGGEHAWSRRYGDAGAHQEGQAISADPDGNVVIGGIFDGSIDFGAGAHAVGSCPSEVWCKQWGFVAKLDSNGETQFSRARGPVRALSGVATSSTGAVFASGALPGNVEPYRIPLLIALGSNGEKRWERQEWPEPGLGAGRQLAVDGCDALLWSLSARPAPEQRDLAYLAKIVN
jgi:hypothetical protein